MTVTSEIWALATRLSYEKLQHTRRMVSLQDLYWFFHDSVVHSTWSTSTSTVLLLSTTRPSTTVSTTVMTFVTTEETQPATWDGHNTCLILSLMIEQEQTHESAYLVWSCEWKWTKKKKMIYLSIGWWLLNLQRFLTHRPTSHPLRPAAVCILQSPAPDGSWGPAACHTPACLRWCWRGSGPVALPGWWPCSGGSPTAQHSGLASLPGCPPGNFSV